MAVEVHDRQSDAVIDEARWSRLAHEVLSAAGVQQMEVSISFVDEETISELKRDHLGGDGGSTDVLAFPMDSPFPDSPFPDSPFPDSPSADGHLAGGPPRMLGDVVVCPAVAARQAPSHAGSLDDEVALLVVHGLLHLLGMDHADPGETALMQRRERELLVAFHGPLMTDPWQDHTPPR